MEYLIRKEPTINQIEYAHVHGEHDKEIRPSKAHIWVSSKNNTMCNMYSGNPESFSEDRWFITDKDQPMVCRMCKKNNLKKGVEGVKDNHDYRTPNRIK